MKTKNLKITDATKEELLQYFFTPSGFGGGFRIPCREDSFILWLSNKRMGEVLDASEASIDASQKYLHEYTTLVKQMIDESDIDKKLELGQMANEAYEKYERANKAWERFNRQIDAGM